ncbi:MAG: hypothetical protein RLZZ453_236 [Chlamydiota bacterium]|jgi:hypothetical protein
MSTSVTRVKAADFPGIVSSCKELKEAVQNVKTAFTSYQQSQAAHDESGLNLKIQDFYKAFQEKLRSITLESPVESCFSFIFEEAALKDRVILGYLDRLASAFAMSSKLEEFCSKTVDQTMGRLNARVTQVQDSVDSSHKSRIEGVFYGKIETLVENVIKNLKTPDSHDISAVRKYNANLSQLRSLKNRLSGSATVGELASHVAQAVIAPSISQRLKGVYQWSVWGITNTASGIRSIWQNKEAILSSPRSRWILSYFSWSFILYIVTAPLGISLNPLFRIPGAIVANIISWMVCNGVFFLPSLLSGAVNTISNAMMFFYNALTAFFSGDLSFFFSSISSLVTHLGYLLWVVVASLLSMVLRIVTVLNVNSWIPLLGLAWKAGLIPEKGRILGYLDRFTRQLTRAPAVVN